MPHFCFIFWTGRVPFCVYCMDRQLPKFMLIFLTLYTDSMKMSSPLDLIVRLFVYVYVLTLQIPRIMQCPWSPLLSRGVVVDAALCAIKLPSSGTL